MPGAVFLRGDDVALRTVEAEDVEFMRDAINDPVVREGLTTAWPINAEQEREYFEEKLSDRETVNLAISPRSDAESSADADSTPSESSADESAVGPDIVGVVGLEDVDQRAGNAEIGIWLAPEYHGRGYGTEASRLLTDFAFAELRLHRVQARVLATNEASARIWEKLGFHEDGVHRDEVFTGGEYVDMQYFGVLEDEWRG